MGEGRYRVTFSPRARDDLREIFQFIAADNSTAAERFGQRLSDEAEATAAHPFAGRMVPDFGNLIIRERIFRAYRIIYRVYEPEGLIVILRFWHGARGKPDLGTA